MLTIVSQTVNKKLQLGPNQAESAQSDYRDGPRQLITKSTSEKMNDIRVQDFHTHEISRGQVKQKLNTPFADEKAKQTATTSLSAYRSKEGDSQSIAHPGKAKTRKGSASQSRRHGSKKHEVQPVREQVKSRSALRQQGSTHKAYPPSEVRMSYDRPAWREHQIETAQADLRPALQKNSERIVSEPNSATIKPLHKESETRVQKHRKLVEPESSIIGNVYQISYVQPVSIPTQPKPHTSTPATPQILQLLQQRCSNGFNQKKNAQNQHQQARSQKYSHGRRPNRKLESIDHSSPVKPREAQRESKAQQKNDKKARTLNMNRNEDIALQQQKANVRHLSLPGDLPEDKSSPQTFENSVQQTISQTSRHSPTEATNLQRSLTVDQFHGGERPPSVEQLAVREQTTPEAVREPRANGVWRGKDRMRLGQQDLQSRSLYNSTGFKADSSALGGQHRRDGGRTPDIIQIHTDHSLTTIGLGDKQGQEDLQGDDGEPGPDKQMANGEQLGSQLQDLQIQSPNGKSESETKNAAPFQNSQVNSRQRKLQEQTQMQAPASAQNREIDPQQPSLGQLGGRIRSTNSIGGSFGNEQEIGRLQQENQV